MSDDYTPIVRGGLKLKGSKPAGIKKKSKSKTSSSSSLTKAISATPETEPHKAKGKDKVTKDEADEEADEERLRELDPRDDDGKTASERAYEEMRRKRLQGRLEKEGVKTHKQKVEELNKYLSNLSEHHDMPRIGPG